VYSYSLDGSHLEEYSVLKKNTGMFLKDIVYTRRILCAPEEYSVPQKNHVCPRRIQRFPKENSASVPEENSAAYPIKYSVPRKNS
jgi:hypothetical protein